MQRSKSSVCLRLQLVAAGADRTGGRRVPQQGDLVGGLADQIEQFFLQHAFDAVTSAVDGADFRHLAGGLDDAAQRVVDDRTGAAALGDHQILGGTHRVSRNRAKTAILPVKPWSHKAASNDEDLRIGHENAREDTNGPGHSLARTRSVAGEDDGAEQPIP